MSHFHGLTIMDLGFLKLGLAQFRLDISIRPISLPFGPNNYSSTIWVQKFIFSVNNCPPSYNMAHGPCLYEKLLYVKGSPLFSLIILS